TALQAAKINTRLIANTTVNKRFIKIASLLEILNQSFTVFYAPNLKKFFKTCIKLIKKSIPQGNTLFCQAQFFEGNLAIACCVTCVFRESTTSCPIKGIKHTLRNQDIV